MRYVIKNGNEFFKWIQWTATIVPTGRTDNFDKAMIIDDEYLDFVVIKRTGETRRQAILKKYPDVELIPVEIRLMEKSQ